MAPNLSLRVILSVSRCGAVRATSSCRVQGHRSSSGAEDSEQQIRACVLAPALLVRQVMWPGGHLAALYHHAASSRMQQHACCRKSPCNAFSMQSGLGNNHSDALLGLSRPPCRVAFRQCRRRGQHAVTCRAAQAAKEVVVVGAGVGGICLAGRLAKRGFNVTVVEKNPEASADLRHI